MDMVREGLDGAVELPDLTEESAAIDEYLTLLASAR
jgi:hypothetical protein